VVACGHLLVAVGVGGGFGGGFAAEWWVVVDANDWRWCFGSQSSPACVVCGLSRWAVESWRLVAVSAGGGLMFVS
jgi:hypothetical protein